MAAAAAALGGGCVQMEERRVRLPSFLLSCCGRPSLPLVGSLMDGYIFVSTNIVREREREREGVGLQRSLRRIIQIFIFPIAKHECARQSRSRNDGSLMPLLASSLVRPTVLF